MARPAFVALLLAAAHPAATRGQPVIPPSAWDCDGSLQVTFAAAPLPAVSCGSEVLQNATSAPFTTVAPVFTLATAAAASTYTLLVVDRDAPNATAPSRSPLLHFATSRVAGAALRSGYTGAASTAMWFNYSGPQPPVGSGCHRYYAFALVEPAGGGLPTSPFTATANATRYQFDFVAWEATNSLTVASSNYWRTQSLAARVGPCPPV